MMKTTLASSEDESSFDCPLNRPLNINRPAAFRLIVIQAPTETPKATVSEPQKKPETEMSRLEQFLMLMSGEISSKFDEMEKARNSMRQC